VFTVTTKCEAFGVSNLMSGISGFEGYFILDYKLSKYCHYDHDYVINGKSNNKETPVHEQDVHRKIVYFQFCKETRKIEMKKSGGDFMRMNILQYFRFLVLIQRILVTQGNFVYLF